MKKKILQGLALSAAGAVTASTVLSPTTVNVVADAGEEVSEQNKEEQGEGTQSEKKETPDMPAKDQEKTQNSGTGSVKTGDEAPFGEIFCVLFLSGAVIAMTVKKKRSKRR